MKFSQKVFMDTHELNLFLESFNPLDFDLHLIFAEKSYFDSVEVRSKIKQTFNNSIIMGCSSSGEILGSKLHEHSFSITSIKFAKAKIKKECFHLKDASESSIAGETIAKQLSGEGLKHVLILSEGINVNGSRLIEGFNKVIDKTVHVSGGLAGDNALFNITYVADLENNFVDNCVSALGFYGDITTETSSYGGWDSFGIDRTVTKSKENVVFEIDGKPALELYKSYLGDKASELPASAFYFPIEMRDSENSELLVRTILGINEEENSITFAGNVSEGSFVRLMKTNVNRVIAGASKSADILIENSKKNSELVILISCVGRKIVLKQLTQDEIEAVTDNFTNEVVFAGFYSNGEISKSKFIYDCKLHNQSMTLTSFSENE